MSSFSRGGSQGSWMVCGLLGAAHGVPCVVCGQCSLFLSIRILFFHFQKSRVLKAVDIRTSLRCWWVCDSVSPSAALAFGWKVTKVPELGWFWPQVPPDSISW